MQIPENSKGKQPPAAVGEGYQPTRKDMMRALALFKVLSHPDRLRLACALGDGRTTTQKELVEEFGWPQSTAARHVTALRNAGLVMAERDGAEVLLRMGNPIATHLLQTVCEWVHQPSPYGEAYLSAMTGVLGASAQLWPAPPPLVGTSAEEADPPDASS